MEMSSSSARVMNLPFHPIRSHALTHTPTRSRHEILSKYFLLTSYTHSVFELLVPPPSTAKAIEQHKASLGVEKPAYKTREEQRIIAGQENEAWRRTLAQLTVHPGRSIPQERDFIVGILLRTKQVRCLIHNVPTASACIVLSL